MPLPLASAKRNFTEARDEYHRSIKATLQGALGVAFQNTEVNTVVWGVCTRPYNDEGAYPGTFGPVLNLGDINDPGGYDFDRDAEYALFYDGNVSDDEAVRAVKALLNNVDLDDFADAFGVSRGHDDGDQIAYVAYRTPTGSGTFKVDRVDIDY